MAEDLLLPARRPLHCLGTGGFHHWSTYSGYRHLPVGGLPAWDALANWLDARLSGGLASNPTQKFNIMASSLAAVTIAVTSAFGMHAMLGAFGVWVGVSGLVQLATGVRRWKTHGAECPMILSGAQLALAGGLFIHRATSPNMPSITAVAPYAAVSAFLLSYLRRFDCLSELRRGKGRLFK